MELFKSFINVMAYASLGFSFAAAYLKLNKLWKRKHIDEVANSVSIVACVCDIIPLTIFSLNFLFVAQWQGFIDSVLWVVVAVIYILIGSGLWVQSNRGKSFWTRLKESLKLEKSEAGHLATTLFRPSSAEIILELFARFAYIDRELADREQALIQSFADNWNIDVNWEQHRELADLEQPVGLVETRDTLARYLDTSPPAEQVAQLIDVLQVLVEVDENVSDAEKLILDEVSNFMRGYINATDAQANFRVVIAPQNRSQDAAIAALLPGAEKIQIAGGSGYLVGSFFSANYANVICDQYRTLGFLTIGLVDDAPVAV